MRYCINCAREINEAAKVCPYCGTSVNPPHAAPAASPKPAAPAKPAAPVRTAAPDTQPNNSQPVYTPQPAPAFTQPNYNQPAYSPQPVNAETLPAQYRPLGPWAYFGLMLLFSVPVVGFVFLIVFSFSNANINRRNFARSFWIPIFIALAVFFILLLVSLLSGNGAFDFIEDLF